MPSAIVHGFYGQRNAGDDAFLLISAWAARKYWGAGTVWAHADRLPRSHGVTMRRMFVSWDKRGATRLNGLLERLRTRAGVTILFGGGSIFHSTPLLESYQRALDRAGDGPHCAAGVSIGPFYDAGAQSACAGLLSRLAFVGVRDRASLERATKLAPRARVELTFDLAPLLSEACGADALAQAGRGRRALGVALRGFARVEDRERSGESRRIARVAEALGECARRRALEEIVMVDLSADPETDQRVHRALAEKLPPDLRVRHEPYADDPLALARTLAGLQGLIAMRLHAAVFAYLGRTPTVILGYHEKCAGWVDMVGLGEAAVVDAERFEAPVLASRIEALLAGAVPLATLDHGAAVEAARRNFTWRAAS
jgi:polysaccharide pyruvyl transferase WcaK-like protein